MENSFKHLRHISSYWEAAKWTMLADYLEKEGKELGTSFAQELLDRIRTQNLGKLPAR